MKKVSRLAAMALLAGAAGSANAWWGGPCSWFGDFFGGGGSSFSFSMGAGGRGWGWHQGAYAPYAHPYAYPAQYPAQYPAPATLTESQQAALRDRQQRFAEQQALAMQQAQEAQRQWAERMARTYQQPMVPVGRAGRKRRAGDPMDPFSGFEPFSMDPVALEDSMPESIKQALRQSEARFEQARSESKARREAFEQRTRERREEMRQMTRRTPYVPEAGQESI